MGVVGLLGLLTGSFAILSASVPSESSPSEHSAADKAAPAWEVGHSTEETAVLQVKLEDVGVSVGAEKAEESSTLEGTMGVSTENMSSALGLNAPAWELGGQTSFNVSQAMGVWRWIELFEEDHRPFPNPCEEWVFHLRGSTVERTRRWRWSGDKREAKNDLTVETQATHQWRDDYLMRTWLKTDYANWGVIMECYNKEVSSCFYFLILSRERTLPPATLEMLRNVAEQRGFQKEHSALVDQTSC